MARRITTLRVLRTERITPRTVRVVAGGEDLAGFPDLPCTDRYVRVVLPRPGVAYGEPFDLDAIRARMPRESWPPTRSYTVRALDRSAGELAIDVVDHGRGGLGAPWAVSARPGDVVRLLGPEGAYAPDPLAGWHLLAGDETALPAIALALDAVPAGAPVRALIEVADVAEEQPLPGAGRVELRWLHRDPARPDQLLDAVRELAFPPGEVHAFVHGETGVVRRVRKHLVGERGVPRARLSVSGYWRRGRTEDHAEDGADGAVDPAR